MALRARVVLIEDGQVALLRQERPPGHVYYMLPGGEVEAGEAPAHAAVREAREELGVTVHVERLLAIVQETSHLHYCFLAHITGGEFGTGRGPEFTTRSVDAWGTYDPIWLPLTELEALDVGPRPLKRALIDGSLFAGDTVQTFSESQPATETS